MGVWTPCVAAVATVLLSACAERPASSSAASAAGTSGAAGLPSVASSAAGTAWRATCDSVAIWWRTAPGVVVTARDTTISVIADTTTRAGCDVAAAAAAGVDSTHLDADYWASAEDARWIPLLSYSADGPGEAVLTWERDGVHCEVRDVHDPGDDADSTYKPSPATSQHTFCWAYQGRPARRDTIVFERHHAPRRNPALRPARGS